MPNDWLWRPLYAVVAIPLGVVAFALDSLAKLLTAIADLCDALQYRWLVRTRLWSGRTATGKTPMMVAEQEAKRQRTLDQLRASINQPLRPLE
jgi:hypothetical protein